MQHDHRECSFRIMKKIGMLIEFAERYHDGHMTIMKFTTNWRVGYGTPATHEDIQQLSQGDTLEEALDGLCAFSVASSRRAD